MTTRGFTVAELLLVVVFIALIVVGPIATIWALNTLFNTGIAYTFWTWLAALLLAGVFKTTTSNGK